MTPNTERGDGVDQEVAARGVPKTIDAAWAAINDHDEWFVRSVIWVGKGIWEAVAARAGTPGHRRGQGGTPKAALIDLAYQIGALLPEPEGSATHSKNP